MAKRVSLARRPDSDLRPWFERLCLAKITRKIRGERGPGRAGPPKGLRSARLGMRENIVGGKAGKVEPDPIGQEAETGGCERLAALARQHGVEPVLERMQVGDVGRRVKPP